MVHRNVSMLMCLLALGCSAGQEIPTEGPAPTTGATAGSGVAVQQVSFNVPDMT